MRSNRSHFVADLERLLQAHPEMKDIIKVNTGSRLFDSLPDTFDAVFAETSDDILQLSKILERINVSNTEMTDHGLFFTKSSDSYAIQYWAKLILARMCRELLNEDNSIKPKVLELLGHTSKTLSSRDLICGYFSIANQYMIKQLVASEAAKQINIDVYNTFMNYVNQYPSWVECVLHDRTLNVKPPYLNEKIPIPKNDHTVNLDPGILGLFALAGFAGSSLAVGLYRAFKKSDDSDESNEDDSPQRSPYNSW